MEDIAQILALSKIGHHNITSENCKKMEILKFWKK
jgi:hypothetical protein